jgi:predicted transcriptional regulator
MPSEEAVGAKDRPTLAEMLERIAAAGSGVIIVPESHRAAVLEGLEQAERGELVSDREMATLWKKWGL